MVLKIGCVIGGKMWMSQRKIMKTIIALEKKHVFHHENIGCKKMPLHEGTLSLHYMSALLPIARDRHLRQNTPVNLESA